ncbi:MAG: low molecular weight protein arginine phosphatase [Candidatus Omnitrophica bacterium]|nr:low molecular weight protein arginine phosphatase [Candidatus Omnitrophota bacterium]
MKTILIVCTGNSCRSVMAAGLLRRLLKGKGDFDVITAGTSAVKGLPATQETIQVMNEQGIDVSSHLSQPVEEEIINRADLILVMESRQREYILTHLPQAAGKTHLLTEFARVENEDKLVDPDIPDPIGKSLEFYRKVLQIIQEGVVRTVKKLEATL